MKIEKKKFYLFLKCFLFALFVLSSSIFCANFLPNQKIYAESAITVSQNNTILNSYDDLSSAFSYASTLTTTETTPAIITINQNCELSSTINIASGKFITLSSGDDYTISRASGFTGYMFNNSGNFTIGKEGKLTLQGIYNQHGNSIVYNQGTLTICNNTVLQNNYAINGGAIYNDSSKTVEINGAKIINCHAWDQMYGNGGALYNEGTMTIDNCEIDTCYSSGDGGIYVGKYAKLTINTGTYVSGSSDGLPLINNQGQTYIKDGTFSTQVEKGICLIKSSKLLEISGSAYLYAPKKVVENLSSGNLYIYGGKIENTKGGEAISHKGSTLKFQNNIEIVGFVSLESGKKIEVAASTTFTSSVALSIDGSAYTSATSPVVTFKTANADNINNFFLYDDGDEELAYTLHLSEDYKNIYTSSIENKAYLNKNWQQIVESNIGWSGIETVEFVVQTDSDVPAGITSYSVGATGAGTLSSDQSVWTSSANCFDVKAYKTGNVLTVYAPSTIYAPVNSIALFNQFNSVKNVTYLDLTNLDTSLVQDMTYMFNECDNLVGTFGLDGTAIKISDKFVITSVEEIDGMFFSCSKLTYLDLSTFDTSYVKDFGAMFYYCSKLSGTFGSNGTAINIGSKFLTTNAAGFVWMFNGCSGLTEIDLSGFSISSTSNTQNMLKNCSSLKTIKLPKVIGTEIEIPSYDKFFVTDKGTSNKNVGDAVSSTVDSNYQTATISKVGYKITLDNQSATTAGTEFIYEDYNVGFYLDMDHSNKMATNENNISLPSKNNYNFAGYYTEENGKGTKFIDENGYLATSASATYFSTTGTLYAYWTGKSYTLTVKAYSDSLESSSFVNNSNGGTVKIGSGNESASETLDVEYNATTQITAKANTGYEFKGWWNNSTFDGDAISTDLIITTDAMTSSGLNYYACFALKTFTITWKQDDDTVIDTTTAKYGELPAHTDPSKQEDNQYSYVFTGWTPAIDEATQDAEYKATYSSTLKEYTLTITYSYEDTTMASQTQTYTYDFGDGYSISSPVITGYTPNYLTVSGTIESDLTVDVIYSANVYNIVYKDKGGLDFSGTIKSGYPTIHTYGIETKLPANDKVSKDKFNFGGWYIYENCSGLPISSIGATQITNDITIYALWLETFSVTYDYSENGGTSCDALTDIMLESGENIDLSYTAEKENWDFVGWNTDKNATTKLNSLKMASENITLYAIYSKNLSVNFYSGINKNKVDKFDFVIYNNETNKNIEMRSAELVNNWTMIGWRTDEQATEQEIESNGNCDCYGDEGFYAVYIRQVEFSFNGNESTSGNVDSIKINQYYNTQDYVSTPSVILPENNFEKTGYKFSKWAVQSVQGNQYAPKESFGDFIPSVNESVSMTFYAKWNPETYTVSFDKNCDDEVILSKDNMTVEFDADYGELATITREGYTFDGWYDKLENGTRITSSTIVKTASAHSLYAYWTIEAYNISFETNCSEMVNSQSYEYGSDLPTISQDGYEFKGWSKVNNKDSEDCFVICPDLGNDGDDITLYALWLANPVNYTINHYIEKLDIATPSISNSNDWVLKETESKVGEAGTQTTPEVETYDGFTSPSAITETILGDGSLVVDYYYTRNQYDVILGQDDGIESVSGSGKYDYGKTITISAEVKNGYEWVNWTGTKTYVNPTVNNIVVGASNIELTANSKIINYIISYNLNNGELEQGKTNPNSYNIESDTIVLFNPIKTGYEFLGWSGTDIANVSKNISITAGSTGNREYIANWKVIEYSIKYYEGTAEITTLTPTSYTIESTNSLPVYVRPGLSFAGWKIVEANGNWELDKLYTDDTVLTGFYGDISLVVQGDVVELVFADKTLSQATYNEEYEATIQKATGGSGDYTYTLKNGSSLPNGLSFDAANLKISGIVTANVDTYTFDIVVYDNVNEISETATYTLTVKAKAINIPQAKQNLVYCGEFISAFDNALEGYSLSLQGETNAGDYTTIATLLNNYVWKDETYDTKSISWSIAEKELTIKNVKVANRIVDGTNIVELSGGELVGVCLGDNVGFTLGDGIIGQTESGKSLAVSTNIELDVASQANYTLIQPSDLTVDIYRITLTLENNDNEDSITKVYLEYNSNVLYSSINDGEVVSLENLTKDLYTFKGYFTLMQGGQKQIDESYNVLFDKLNENTTLYAHWLKTSFIVQVYSYSNSGDSIRNYRNNAIGGIIIVEGEEGNVFNRTLTGLDSVNIKAIVADNYNFEGWFTNFDMKGEPYSTDLELNINLDEDDILLYAKFSIKTTTSRFVKYGIIAAVAIVVIMLSVIISTRIIKKRKRKNRSKRFILTNLD